MQGLLVRTAITALGLYVASELVSGVNFTDLGSLALAALLLGLANAVVRPIIVVLTLPITFVTLGLFLWVINAAMLMGVASLMDGFELQGWGAAMWGALLVSVTGWVAASFVGPKGQYEVLVVRRHDSIE